MTSREFPLYPSVFCFLSGRGFEACRFQNKAPARPAGRNGLSCARAHLFYLKPGRALRTGFPQKSAAYWGRETFLSDKTHKTRPTRHTESRQLTSRCRRRALLCHQLFPIISFFIKLNICMWTYITYKYVKLLKKMIFFFALFFFWRVGRCHKALLKKSYLIFSFDVFEVISAFGHMDRQAFRQTDRFT